MTMIRIGFKEKLSGWMSIAICVMALILPGPIFADEPGEISLAMRDAELSEVMEMLSRHERVNILLTDGVDGQVSFSLFDVNLDQAIHTIANAAGYAVEVRQGNYFIVNHDDAGKYVPDGITAVRSFEVRYADPENLRETLTPYLSAYGKMTLATDRRLLIVEDTPEFIKRIEGLMKDLDREPRQILIEAKILEITLDDEDAFGLDWTRLFNSDGGGGDFGAQGLAPQSSLGLFFNYATPDVEATLAALTARGRVRTLSTPKLLALQNQEASVIIGDRRGYQVTTTINQVTSESIEFLESGVILRVTPNVDDHGRVMMEIHPEVSNGTVDANGIPSQTTTEVTTNLIVPSGKTIFIGGLMKHTLTEVSNGVPVLGSLPGIGRLFSSSQKTNVNTETIVLITPHIVNGPADAWSEQERQIVEAHEVAVRSEQIRMHGDVNKKFRATGVNLSRYDSMRIGSPSNLGSEKTDETSLPAAVDHTLYLLHVDSEKEARNFVARHRNDSSLRYYPARGGQQFVVVYGSFRDAAAAMSAIKYLPDDIARLGPEVRSLQSVADTRG